MKEDKKVEIQKGDVLLIKNYRSNDVECVLVLDRIEEGIKILVNSNVRTYKTTDFFFEKEVIFQLG